MKLKSFVLAGAVLACTVASAQNLTDQQFVERAAQINMTEAHLGQLAQQQGSSADIKNYGKEIENEHKNAYDKLTATASGFNLPRSIDSEHQQVVDRLKDLSGEEFDRQFKKTMVDNHEKAVDLYQRASNQLNNQDLRNYANQQLPVLREHLQSARTLGTDTRSQMQGTSSTHAGSQQTATQAEQHTTQARQESTQAGQQPGVDQGTSDRQEQRSRMVTGTGQDLSMQAHRQVEHHGTVTRYEAGKEIELKIRDRLGRHIYDISEGQVVGEVPGNIRVGSTVKVTETVDRNGHRALKISEDASAPSESGQRSRNP